ncbi:MAG TPA: hypothetical protein VHN99_10285, partial [Deinococcales bacterium]|nr:hypothetical protein [Deinococcales bacterium]
MARPFKPLALLAASLLLGGCAFTFLPLVPDPLPDQTGVTAAETLTRDGSSLVVEATFRNVPGEGYASVYLYRDDVKVGEDSQLVGAGNPPAARFTFSPAVVGTYRAVLFFGGVALR